MRHLLIILLFFTIGTGTLYAQAKHDTKDTSKATDSSEITKIEDLQRQMIRIDQDSLKYIKKLHTLVNTGYGYEKAGEITGSVSSVKTKQISTGQYSNIYEYLRGRVAGLMVTPFPASSSGYRIQIRGMNSINGSSEPLVILNGTPLSSADDLQYLNPNDVKHVSVIKDASAAIYGVRGSNGVILITTKGN
jgi:TonB-dependent SusC/RagA subfamily outer membrane receptor